jgi:hypothetical protein
MGIDLSVIASLLAAVASSLKVYEFFSEWLFEKT